MAYIPSGSRATSAPLPTVAVVDGYSTGRLIAGELRRRDAAVIHVISQPEMPEYFAHSFRAEDYDACVEWCGSMEHLVKELAGLGVNHVVAGTESGVRLADALSSDLGLASNERSTARARRHKELMSAAATAAGLAAPRSRAFTCARDAVAWVGDLGLAQVVVKPVDSAGSDNVRLCSGVQAVSVACDAVLRSTNLYGSRNREVLVQERIHGTEYYVNTVSFDGTHRVAEMWRYTKSEDPSGSPVYDFEEPVGTTDPKAGVLRTFVFAVLDSLGVQSYAAHTEVMVTEQGPVLIECGARLGGGTLPDVVARYSGVSQLGLLIDTLMDPASLLNFDDTAVTWSEMVRNVAFQNHVRGTVTSMDWAARVSALPTAVAVVPATRAGAPIDITRDLVGSPGYVYLAAPDQAAVRRDYEHLRRLERSGLYTT
jgi:biotin carboxylase